MRYVGRNETERNRIVFYHVPTVRGSIHGLSIDRYYSIREYARTLDTVLENADALYSCNGVSIEEAVKEASAEEDMYVLPRHRALIKRLLEAE